MVLPGIALLFLVACFEGASCMSIDCGVTAESLLLSGRCEYNQSCTVHCKSACVDNQQADVYGTVIYAVESSVCKSAFHDLRISAWNLSAMQVSFVSSKEKRSDYTGSLRYGVTSKSSFLSSEYFGFQTPRIKEEVLDVTALHRNYIYDDNTMSTLECHGPEDRRISFDFAIKEVLPKQNVNFHPTPVQGAHILTWPKGVNTHTRTNMLWCHVYRSTLSSIGSPSMYYKPPDKLSFLPVNYTVTASPQEPATLQVQAGPGVAVEPHVGLWAKVNAKGHAETLISHGSSSSWSIGSVRIEHSAVYMARDQSTVSPGKHRAIFRLIVRTCPSGLFGPLCDFHCPFCQNGGICHDITGQCICPPGFRGQVCEAHCGDDAFGRECQHKCSDTNPDKNVRSCRGILMCLPDPYGCSCGTGFHGPFCDQTCPPHHYGADCKQSRVCFCKTQQSCDIHTGTCVQDKGVCRWGWRNGPFCDKSYPLLHHGPLVGRITDKEIIINFNAWDPSTDIGEGKPREYRVDYKVGNETWISKTVPHRTYNTRHNVSLTQLRSGTKYHVRVLVIDEDNNYREHGANVSEFQTTCGAPARPPENVKIDNSSATKIVVKWTNPARQFWNCWSVNVVLEVNALTQEFNLTASGTAPNDMYTIPVTPYTTATIRLRLRTPDNMYSVWTKNMTVVSAEDAPSKPQFIALKRAASRTVEITWGRPEHENGLLRHYSVVYTPLKFLASGCGPLEERETEVIVPPRFLGANLTGLRPFTMYRVSVAAVTVRKGNASTFTLNTVQAVADGAPTRLTRIRITGAPDTLRWSAVPCEAVNGYVREYYVELESSDAWEAELRNMRVRSESVTYADLVPYTTYTAKVFAVNDAGRSEKFATLNFTTDPAAPPPPSDLASDLLSQVSVSLSWDSPYPPYGVLVQYQLKYWKGNAVTSATETEIVPINCARRNSITLRHCYTVKNLDPEQVYHFTVRAKNEDTDYSAYGPVLDVETREMPPEAPASILSLNETEDTLMIQWEPPLRKNGGLTGYEVTSSLSHSYNTMLKNSWQPQSMQLSSSDKPEVFLRGLFPGSTYLVCVKVSTSAGFGDAICENFSTKASPPELQVQPMVGAIANHTVNIVLNSVDFMRGPITGYYLVVVRQGSSIPKPVRLVNYSTAEDMRLGYYVAAHLSPGELKDAVEFLVGGGNVVGGFENPPLTDATPYRFGLLAETNFSGRTAGYLRVPQDPPFHLSFLTSDKKNIYLVKCLENWFLFFHFQQVLYGYSLTAPVIVNDSGNAAGAGIVIEVTLVLLILMLAATALTYYYIRKKQAVRCRFNGATKRSLNERLSRLLKLDENSMPESRMTLNMESSDSVNMSVIPNGGLPSKPVPVKRLQDHAIQGQANGVLEEEYMTTAMGQLHPWDIAKKAKNKPKNRYGNILPYDHSRVILSPLPGFDTADYINASYVPGYRCPRKYIATQGPKQTTLTDFWRMVWQEGSCKVVMLTNLKEQEKARTKTVCEQYWPETSQKYGKFVVTLMKTDMQVDFVVREFQLELESKTRTVVQFHFTTWPVHGILLYPDALLPFLRRIWDFQPHDEHPVIVHCSGGIGRTGTLILVDSMLAQAEAEGEVNLVSQLHVMRQSRVNLVESLEQYIFAYMALVEILCSKNHKLSVKEFVTLYQKLKAKGQATGKSAIELEYEELARACPLPGPEDYSSACQEKNAAKNRLSKILTGHSRRSFLSVTADGSKSDYINAVYVDGFKRRKAYLTTLMPLPETVGDFWQMIAASGSVTLVTLGPLEDETTPQFWPNLKTTVRYGKILVEQTDTQDFRRLLVRTFKVSQGARPARTLKQFHSHTWKRSHSVPSSCDVVLEILQHVDRWQMQAEGGSVVVQCLDGCQQCGLYCVSAAICDQLKLEQELDVFRSVRNVRKSRPQFIVDSEQYAFCYDLALSFLETFDTYSNFQ